MVTWTTTMTRNPSQNQESGSPTSASRANEPLTLLTMNQPNAPVIVFRPAGRILPRNPNAPRLATIIGTPNFGPQDERIACVNDPRAEPISTAVAVCHRLRPNRVIAIVPTKIVANSRFGESHVQKRSIGFPWRSLRAMYSTPPGSTVATLSP